MCGLSGMIKFSGNLERDIVKRMNETLIHRGPDDGGYWFSDDGVTGLGHRRLSIIDLSPSAHQPMIDVSGKFIIVFNGEIYNYKELRIELSMKGHTFRSSSDTEVIVAAYKEWGHSCPTRLVGMFAFAIHDTERNTLFLTRDRAGEKPLYFSKTEESFTFASELKALMANPSHKRTLDLVSLNYYLTYGYIPADKCILKNTSKLPPAHSMLLEIKSRKFSIWKYWHIPAYRESLASIDDLSSQLEHLIEDSVKRQLVADVPVGILLSGGVDSSIVTAYAAKLSSRPVNTFCISFPGHAAHDEARHAKIVADYFGTNHIELAADPASVDLLPILARQFDEPMCDSSMIPTYMVSKLVRQHATVALGGDGGDELFGGYWHYSRLIRMESLRGILPRHLREMMGRVAAFSLPAGFRGRNYALGLAGGIENGIAHAGQLFDRHLRKKLLINEYHDSCSIQPEEFKMGLCDHLRGIPSIHMAADFLSYLPEDILVKLDRASMLASLEIRAPLLDHRIIEFAFGNVPNSLKATKKNKKILLKHLAKRVLPPTLNTERKQGFSIPLRSWFSGSWGEQIKSVLSEGKSRLFDKDFVQMLITQQDRGMHNTERLFGLTLF